MPLVSGAQLNAVGLIDSCELLTATDKVELKKAIKLSPEAYQKKADSFSRLGDSVNAGLNFLNVDPYYLMFSMCEDTSKLPWGKLNISAAAKEKSLNNLSLARAKRTAFYYEFKEMADEDQKYRLVAEKCEDSLTCLRAQQRIRRSDSIHFAFLKKYVETKGWPTGDDGGNYAILLALHDHANHSYYIPVIAKELLRRPISAQAFLLMLYWDKNARLFADYDKFLATRKYEKFDISGVIDLKLPSAMERIEKAVMRRCPAQLYVVFESPDNNKFSAWLEKAEESHRSGKAPHIMAQLTNRLRPLCPGSIVKDIWSAHYQPSTSKTRVILYVVYE